MISSHTGYRVILILLACIVLLAEIVLVPRGVGNRLEPDWLHTWTMLLFSIVNIVLFVVAVLRKMELLMVLSIVAFVQVAADFTDFVVAAAMWYLKVLS